MLAALSDAEFDRLEKDLAEWEHEDRRDNALLYYRPVSDRALAVHRSTAKTIGIGGGNRACLPLTASVLMADGTWQSLATINVGDRIIAADPLSGEAAPSYVTATHRSGRREVFRMLFSDGGSFEATADHCVPLYVNAGRKTSKGNPVIPYKRRLGDYLNAIPRRCPAKRISAVSPSNIQFCARGKLGLSPYLLGALLGDGSLGSPLRFHNSHSAVLARVKDAVREFGLTLVYYGRYDYGISSGRFTNNTPNRLMVELRRLGLWHTNSYTKFIPDEAWGLDRSERLELLAGLIDTDGTAHGYSTCSKKLADGFVRLVRSLGGKATSRYTVSRCQTGASVNSYLIYWRVNCDLPLSVHYKKQFQTKRAVNYSRRVCRSVESRGYQECGDLTVNHPAHCYVTGDWVIVSNSKTDTVLAELCALASGVIPLSLQQEPVFLSKFRGPIRIRIVCKSLTTNLYEVMIRKLRWHEWSGIGQPGSARGHYGWVPKHCLIDGEWDASWSEKYRILRFLCRNPKNPEEILGESTIQIMSGDQEHHQSAEYHAILLDEPPDYGIWHESIARVMSLGGRIYLAMTWPDDPSCSVEWLFDDIYDKAQPGPHKDPETDWFNLYTTENPNVDQKEIAIRAAQMSDTEKQVRIYGQPIRFSNRIHPLFTDQEQTWCMTCGTVVIADRHVCTVCHGSHVVPFCHLQPFEAHPNWPTVHLLDPHPRKPHMGLLVQIDPSDDWFVLDELIVTGDPLAYKQVEDAKVQEYKIRLMRWLMDPNMGGSPAGTNREITWQTEFLKCGLPFELADDGAPGRSLVDERLKPDRYTERPRLTIHPRCTSTRLQMKRWCWREDRDPDRRGLRQQPDDKHSDFPTLLKYLANDFPTFEGYRGTGQLIRYAGEMRNGYYG